MKCEECKNRGYCLAYATESEMYGCTSGTPPFQPTYVAEDIARRIKTGCERLGLDELEYKQAIFNETERLLKYKM